MKRAVLTLVFLAGCGGGAATQAPATPTGGAATEAAPNMETKKAQPALVTPEQEMMESQVAFDEAEKAFAAAGTDCASLCKALASMQRSTDRLCELAKDGPKDDQDRCTDARAKVDDATTKVKSSCGGCG